MRPFIELSNTEKAKYFHQFFPREIPAILSWIEYIAADLVNNKEQAVKDFKHKTISKREWIALALKANTVIKEQRALLTTDSQFFADQLFPAYMGIFSLYCIQEFINVTPNRRLIEGVKFFFDLVPVRQLTNNQPLKKSSDESR